MITENGTIKVTTEMNGKVQKEFSDGNFKAGLALTIIGAIGVAVFLALEIAAVFLEWEDQTYFSFLLVFAVFLGCGIGLLVIINKAVATAGTVNKVYTYEFFKDYFTATESFNGENVATAKFYNTQIIKAKETKNYLFFYTNAAAACPVEKSELTEAELNTLRRIFRLPVKGNTVELSAEILPRPENNENTSVPDDPFDEFKN